MCDVVILFRHLIVTVVRLARPGGLRSVVAEALLVKHPLRIGHRCRCWVVALSGDLPSRHKPSPCPTALALRSVSCETQIAERPQASPLQPNELHLRPDTPLRIRIQQRVRCAEHSINNEPTCKR